MTRVAHNLVNRLGQRYGKLTVIASAGRKGTAAAWLCACDCGKHTIVASNSLRNGTQSCGCFRATGAGSRPYRINILKPGEASRNRVLSQYKRDAVQRNLVWDLTNEQFFNIIARKCAYCGAPPFSVTKISTNGDFVRNGIDRVNNSIGYTLDNSIPCCTICNHAKKDMTKTEFENWIERLLKNRYPDGYRANPLIKYIEPFRKEPKKSAYRRGSILTDEQVRSIRTDPRRPFRPIAEEYKISESFVGQIKSGKARKNV